MCWQDVLAFFFIVSICFYSLWWSYGNGRKNIYMNHNWIIYIYILIWINIAYRKDIYYMYMHTYVYIDICQCRDIMDSTECYGLNASWPGILKPKGTIQKAKEKVKKSLQKGRKYIKIRNSNELANIGHNKTFISRLFEFWSPSNCTKSESSKSVLMIPMAIGLPDWLISTHFNQPYWIYWDIDCQIRIFKNKKKKKNTIIMIIYN